MKSSKANKREMEKSAKNVLKSGYDTDASFSATVQVSSALCKSDCSSGLGDESELGGGRAHH